MLMVASMLRRVSPDQLDEITEAFQKETRAILRKTFHAADAESQEKINKVSRTTIVVLLLML